MAWKKLTEEWDQYLQHRAELTKPGTQARAAAPASEVERIDRFMLNRLLLDVASSLDSLAFSYRKIYEMAEAREKRAGAGRS